MNVVQTVPYIGDESSGPSYSVPALCTGTLHAGCQVALHVLSPVPRRDFEFPVIGYERMRLPHPRFGRSPEMLKGLRQACAKADVIHNSSLWMFSNVYCDWARKGMKCKLVMQPRGAMSAWALANSKWAKRIFGFFFQYEVLRHVDMWVATAQSEYEDIRRLGYRQPVCILPNGIDLPSDEWVKTMKANMPTRRRMYFLSRLHPKKNVEMLIKAWAKLEKLFADWDLIIVGPDADNPYADQMKALARDCDCQRVSFVGELKGEAKREFMVTSECIVLPTHSENFGMVIAESLACGTPAICSYGAPWEGLNAEKCGWWVPTRQEEFERAMSEMMAMPREKILAMGARGREWMRRDFSWDGIGMKMKAAYEWLVHGGERPEHVKID